MEFVTRYEKHKKVAQDAGGKSLTEQSHKKDCDINNILKKFNKDGVLPGMIKTNPTWGDFSEVEDYRTSLEIVAKASEQFLNLPSRVRNRFQNDPALFLQFANDPKNIDEMISMGLATRKEGATPPSSVPSPEPEKAAKAISDGQASPKGQADG